VQRRASDTLLRDRPGEFGFILIAGGSLRTGEHLAVSLIRPALRGPLVKQRWIIRKLHSTVAICFAFGMPLYAE